MTPSIYVEGVDATHKGLFRLEKDVKIPYMGFLLVIRVENSFEKEFSQSSMTVYYQHKEAGHMVQKNVTSFFEGKLCVKKGSYIRGDGASIKDVMNHIDGFLIQTKGDDEDVRVRRLVDPEWYFTENTRFPRDDANALVSVERMTSIPVGANPFAHDSISMGIDLVHKWTVMYQSSGSPGYPESLPFVYLVNGKTGNRARLWIGKDF